MKLPPPFSWFYDAWMAFSHALGMVMSKIILTILWIVGFGTYGIILKIIKLFRSRASPCDDTYWIDVPPLPPDDLHHQF